ncbi:MAG: hypothetical protein LBR81_07760 [Prevotellaceae bacterium]|jgi:hypothetical protein|nr:hypothetical protein [Prevotellaceae bacterium]
MDFLTILLAATIPAMVIAAVVYLLINKMLKAESERRNFEVRKTLAPAMLPIRLKAYERMVIFVERITPESLLTRQSLSGKSAQHLQTALLQQIREEWEHNAAQQLYISSDTWLILRNARESIVQLVNTCAAEASMNTSALEYATAIIEKYRSVEKTPLDVALAMLKNDVGRF